MQNKTEKNTEISERIRLLIKELSENPNSFAKKLGYDRTQAVYDMLNGKAKPSFDFFERILNSEYSESINLSWIINGKGSLFNTNTKEITQLETKSNVKMVDNTFLLERIESLVIENHELKNKLEDIKSHAGTPAHSTPYSYQKEQITISAEPEAKK